MKILYKVLCSILCVLALSVGAAFALRVYSDAAFDGITTSSNVPLDIVFICHPKDFEILPYSVKSVRKYLKQPISKIVLIAPRSDEAIKIAESLNMEYVDENSILSYKNFIDWVQKNNLSQNYGGSWSWYYQQFLKLLYYKIAKSDNYFVIDADIVMNKPFVLVTDEGIRTFFVGENSGHEMSSFSIKALLGEEQFVPEFSFIADLMCFNKSIVKNVITKIEQRFNIDFYKAAILVEQNSKARFSEYEMYGVYANFSEDLKENKGLTNYLKMSRCVRRRQLLFNHYFSNPRKCNYYIAYHYWFSYR